MEFIHANSKTFMLMPTLEGDDIYIMLRRGGLGGAKFNQSTSYLKNKSWKGGGEV